MDPRAPGALAVEPTGSTLAPWQCGEQPGLQEGREKVTSSSFPMSPAQCGSLQVFMARVKLRMETLAQLIQTQYFVFPC